MPLFAQTSSNQENNTAAILAGRNHRVGMLTGAIALLSAPKTGGPNASTGQRAMTGEACQIEEGGMGVGGWRAGGVTMG